MTNEQRAKLAKLMESKGLGTSADKAAFFSHVLDKQEKTLEFARDFIENFEEKHKRWISEMMTEVGAG